MSVIKQDIITMSCDGPECKNSVVFALALEEQTANTPGNEWMKAVRIVKSADGRTFLYCSDVCEVKGIGTGQHNRPEPKKIIGDAGSAAAVAQAAAAAEQAKKATEALKQGQGVTLG